MTADERPPGEEDRVPTLVLDEEASPQRLLRDPWRLTRAEVIRIAAALAILLVLFALAAFLVWRRLRIRSLLRPIPHRARPVAGAPPVPGALDLLISENPRIGAERRA